MLPYRGGILMALKIREAVIMNLITAKISYLSLLLTKEAI